MSKNFEAKHPANNKFRALALSFFLFILAVAPSVSLAEDSINLYSSRQAHLIQPILDAFTDETGIEINLTSGKPNELLARIKSEAARPRADALIMTDAGMLFRSEAYLAPIESEEINNLLAPQYRNAQGLWYALSLRARVIAYAKDRISKSELAKLASYNGLVDPDFKGRVCVRSSGNIYNQSFIAALIANEGEEAAKTWMEGFVENFAKRPSGGDRDQIRFMAAGRCDVALINTYYYLGMQKSQDAQQREAAGMTSLAYPDQNGHGTHVNITGAAMIKGSQKEELVRTFIEFMLSDKAQNWYAEVNNEFPVRGELPFKADTLSLETLGQNNVQAVRLMDAARWQ